MTQEAVDLLQESLGVDDDVRAALVERLPGLAPGCAPEAALLGLLLGLSSADLADES